ncbi:hypothetical protein EFO98_15305, partial [Lactiplantibacillus argentoratensis]|nr:hypothetical protein [Lactiplantibacillus argentoratensis]
QLLKDGFVVNTILKEADLFCPNSVRINFTIYHKSTFLGLVRLRMPSRSVRINSNCSREMSLL